MAQWSHQLSEVNGLMMTYCHSWKIKRLHCKTIIPPESRICKLDAYVADCNVNNCMKFGKKTLISFQNYQLHLKHHCIAATSAAMERCSSAAISEMLSDPGWLIRHWKLGLMLIAKCNKDFMDK